MKTVILAGGSQSTIHPERDGIPKPMIELGERPLLWHIMKSFSGHGITEFIVCGGYKVEMIKEYFLDYYIYASDITVDLATNTVKVHKNRTEDWKVTVVNTGKNTSPMQRVRQVLPYMEDDFFVTYGDCLSDIDLSAMVQLHKETGNTATIAMVKPSGRKQFLSFDDRGTLSFNRLGKDAEGAYGWINGTIYLFKPEITQFLGNEIYSEETLFAELSETRQITPFYHNGFWVSIETLRDLVSTERLWERGTAPWVSDGGGTL